MSDTELCPACGQPLPGPDLISPLEAAQILGGISTKTVTRWADDGLLGPIEFTEGRQRRFRRDAVEEYAAARAELSAVAAEA
jgi:excisionase family DNA binding protein